MKIRSRLRRLRWPFPKVYVVFFFAAAAVAMVAVVLSGQLVALSDQDREEAVFINSAELPTELLDTVSWEKDRPNLPRQMDPLTRRAVTISWVRAWEQLSIISQTGDTSGVEVYFSNDAKRAVLNNSSMWENRRISQRSHTLQLTFFSDDGQVLAMNSTSTVERGLADLPEAATEIVEDYEVIMLLEDGNWRVQHMVRRSSKIGDLKGQGQ